MEDNLSPIGVSAARVKEPLLRLYSRLDYFQFCTYLGFDPQHSEQYWKSFQTLIQGLSAFDNQKLQKMLDYDPTRETK